MLQQECGGLRYAELREDDEEGACLHGVAAAGGGDAARGSRVVILPDGVLDDGADVMERHVVTEGVEGGLEHRLAVDDDGDLG